MNNPDRVHASQSIYFDAGAVRAVAVILDELAPDTVLLVADEPAYSLCGASAALAECFARRRVEKFSEFQLNPKIEDIQRGVDTFRRVAPEAIVAIGGGSAIDVAKAIGTCGVQSGPPKPYVTGEALLERDGPPLVAVPTTAGTGSEATRFAVAYVDGQKFSLTHDFLLPEFAVLDPVLTYTLPPEVTASSGLDALCQAIESIWAVGATGESIVHASLAVELAIEHLESAVHHPTPQARRGMMQAAHLAGAAINISKTTAPHAFSYAVTLRHGVPHGVAVALTLGTFLRYNSQVDDDTCADPRGTSHVRQRIDTIVKLLGGRSVDDACGRLDSLIQQLGCPTRLSGVGIRPADVEPLVALINAERSANNPRVVDRAALTALLTERRRDDE